MRRAEINDMIAAINHQAEKNRRRSEPIAWGIALAIMLGIASAVLFARWLACGAC